MEIFMNDECCKGDIFELDDEPCCDRWRVGRRLINLGPWGGTGSMSALSGLTVCEL